MNDPFAELPVLPVVIPVGILLFAILLLVLRSRRRLTLPRAAVAAALGVYAAGVLGNTVFPIFLHPTRTGPWEPALALVPFADYEFEDALMNMLVFVPLGILVALLLTRPTWWRVVAICAGVSLTVELMQLGAQDLFGGGHVADVNDFLSNTAGGAIGFAAFVLLTRVPLTARLVEPFRWRTAELARA